MVRSIQDAWDCLWIVARGWDFGRMWSVVDVLGAKSGWDRGPQSPARPRVGSISQAGYSFGVQQFILVSERV